MSLGRPDLQYRTVVQPFCLNNLNWNSSRSLSIVTAWQADGVPRNNSIDHSLPGCLALPADGALPYVFAGHDPNNGLWKSNNISGPGNFQYSIVFAAFSTVCF